MNNVLLNLEQRDKEEIKKGIKAFLEISKNEQKSYWYHFCETAKAVVRGKCIVIKTYISNVERYGANIPTEYLMDLKEEQINPKVSIMRKIINLGTEKHFLKVM